MTAREVASWRDHLAATAVRALADGRAQLMAPATVNNHLAHLSALFTWTAAHAPAGLLPHGDPTKGVDPLPLPAPEPRALTEAQVRTVKNVLDRLDGFHRLRGRRHQGGQVAPVTPGAGNNRAVSTAAASSFLNADTAGGWSAWPERVACVAESGTK
ncbi:MAG TPA: hypothetical protein VF951_03395 [Streptosporangiaceae bacterium]